jgi:hypothetical protein
MSPVVAGLPSILTVPVTVSLPTCSSVSVAGSANEDIPAMHARVRQNIRIRIFLELVVISSPP